MAFFAKKSLGQHFLIDPNIRSKILDAAELTQKDHVVEIGSGKGFLTKGLVKSAGTVTAIETDPRCIAALRENLDDPPNLDLVHGNALEYPYENFRAGFKVVSNLPYYLSTPLLFRLLKERSRICRMVLMIQKEIAQRLVAKPGTKQCGALSLSVQFLCDIQLAFRVSPHAFRPRPKVMSTVVVMVPRPHPAVAVRDEPFFLSVVRKAFLHRRKLVKNALLEAGFPAAPIASALSESQIDPRRRPETLTLKEYAILADRLFEKTRGL